MDQETALKQMDFMKEKSKNMRLAAEEWKNDFEILISTILSARTRDEVTIPVSTKLFEKYPTPESLASASLEDVEELIKPINFYRNKSKSITNCSKELVKNHNSKVPRDLEELKKLPGVGSKTANVFLSEVGEDAIGIDTHLNYISNYLGWTKYQDPNKIEEDLKKLFEKKHWSRVNPIVVRFGKTYTSRKEKDKLLDEIKKIK